MLNLNTNTLQEPHIIIVDNDPDDNARFLNCFQHLNWHHQVKMLNDADALFELLDNTPHLNLLPTLIVLDYNLPRLGGETTLILLKKDKRFQSIPVVLFTTSISDRMEKQLLSLGALLCIRKPKTIDGIHWQVVELMELAKAQFHSHQMALTTK
ncbi:response regulator [Flavisolibacter tropicus]|uniref:Response regulatory domain-containing protein n=1 Tax=Flavisolibacter tropicus TaxID=1492898 RepID=A0A172TTJ9_9BACT|nr:response regulator [Flavisolibacter tropicus]ANE50431.1 hypothetical protein SY85_07925 [Flavisolibacter tropicus]